MAVKTFAVGEVLTASDTNTFLANPAYVSTAQVTIGTSVSTVTVSNCFNATYTTYLVHIRVGSHNTPGAACNIQLSGSTGATYNSKGYFGVTSDNLGYSSGNNLNQTSWMIGGVDSTAGGNYRLEIFQPFLTKATTLRGLMTSTTSYREVMGSDSSTASSTGFTFTIGSGAQMTGGTISVFGVRLP